MRSSPGEVQTLDAAPRLAQDRGDVSESKGLRSIGILHPTFESWGGAEWFIHQCLGAFARRGLRDATVYTHRWSPPPGESAGYHVVEHRRGGVHSAPWDWERIAREQAHLWRQHSVLFVHNWPATHWYQVAAGRFDVPPAVWYCHEPPAALHGAGTGRESEAGWADPAGILAALRFYGVRTPWRALSRLRLRRAILSYGEGSWLDDLRRRERIALGAIPRILANSRYTAAQVRTLYDREAEVVYPVPADLASLSPAGRQIKEPEILFVARLTEAKRPHVLLSAWQQAVESETGLAGYRLVIVGDGPLRGAIEERIRRQELGATVELLRDLPRPELIRRYRRAVLTIHLGLGEPFGLVPLESMAAGTAVLAEGGGGARETILDGVTGWAVDGLDESTLADWLARVPRMREQLEDLGRRAAVHAAERFRPAASLDRLVAVLTEAAASR